MGAFLDDLDPKRAAEVGLPIREGVVVLNLFQDGPSHQAGIMRGDIILSMDGHKVETTRVLTRLLRQDFKPGQEIQVELFREGTKLTLPLVLKERPRV
jgi:S1-C subfamily serine protease